jgi:hypothetical protein
MTSCQLIGAKTQHSQKDQVAQPDGTENFSELVYKAPIHFTLSQNMLVISALSTLLLLGIVSAKGRKSVVEIKPDVEDCCVDGQITFTQKSSKSRMQIHVDLSGFEPNTWYGWRIRDSPIGEDLHDCNDAFGWSNPNQDPDMGYKFCVI